MLLNSLLIESPSQPGLFFFFVEALLCGSVILPSSLFQTRNPQFFTECLIQHGVSYLLCVLIIPLTYISGCQCSFHNLLASIELRTLAVKCRHSYPSQCWRGETHSSSVQLSRERSHPTLFMFLPDTSSFHDL